MRPASALLASLIGSLSALLLLVAGGLVEDKYSCPHGWTRYGTKKCLKYINELQDYERAQTTCRSKNQGSLVSIHSHEEQNFVYSYIHSIAASSTPVWLGAKQIDFESILWLDKTENSYTNWAPSEPSHPDEICIAINPRNGMWHDVMCTEANVPACERAPTTQWPFFVAFCSEGWFQFNDEKCVRIISSQALNFYESQELCRSKYNSKLLSIKTDRESEFLHNLIKFRDVKLPVWLGAVQNDFSSFNWIDKSDVTFTNWAEGEPNDPDHACLSMTASGAKWADNDCKEQKLILCQKVPEDSACETGWLQFRQDKCYRFVHIRLAFDDAESLCNNLYGGHLPSIHSQEEQFMISQFLASVNVKNGSEIWLGGRQMDFHNFNWGDGSLFNYSYWEHGEPNFPAEKCIEMSWRNGRWNDISCRLKRAVLCERQVSSRHSSQPLPPTSTSKPPPLYNANCLNGEKSSNCTGASDGVVSGLGAVLVGQSGAELAPQDSAQEASSQPPSAFSPDVNSNLSTSTTTTTTQATQDAFSSMVNRSSAPSPSEQAAAGSGGLMLPPDDQPIKMITLIMNKEQPPAEPAFLPLPAANLSTAATTTNQSSETNSTSEAAHSSLCVACFLDARPAQPAVAEQQAPSIAVAPSKQEQIIEPRAAIAQQSFDSTKPNHSAPSSSSPLMEKIWPQQQAATDTTAAPLASSSNSSSTATPLVAQKQLSHSDILASKTAASSAPAPSQAGANQPATPAEEPTKLTL